MKAEDHSDCSPNDCQHKREARAAELIRKQEDEAKEVAYYEEKRRRRAREAAHDGEDAGVISGKRKYPTNAYERSALVQELELELMRAREEQVTNGDPMPLQSIRNVVGDALRLLEHKNEQYGDAWRKQGYMGNLARIQSKAERLKSLLWRDAGGNGYPLPANYSRDGETVVDTLLDLINLAAMAAINWTEENRWG